MPQLASGSQVIPITMPSIEETGVEVQALSEAAPARRKPIEFMLIS